MKSKCLYRFVCYTSQKNNLHFFMLKWCFGPSNTKSAKIRGVIFLALSSIGYTAVQIWKSWNRFHRNFKIFPFEYEFFFLLTSDSFFLFLSTQTIIMIRWQKNEAPLKSSFLHFLEPIFFPWKFDTRLIHIFVKCWYHSYQSENGEL